VSSHSNILCFARHGKSLRKRIGDLERLLIDKGLKNPDLLPFLKKEKEFDRIPNKKD